MGVSDKGDMISRLFLPVIYFLAPIALSLVCLGFGVMVPSEALGLVISVFSIVSALLFGALFSIFSVISSIDRSKLAREFENIAPFKGQLRQINRSVVYLVALSSVCVCVSLFFYLVAIDIAVETFVLVALISHFFTIFFPLLLTVFRILDLAYRKI